MSIVLTTNYKTNKTWNMSKCKRLCIFINEQKQKTLKITPISHKIRGVRLLKSNINKNNLLHLC